MPGVQPSVGSIWLLEASRCPLGWVSCSQLCVSTCSHDVCCICRPPTQPSARSLLLRFVSSCSPLRCTLFLSLCLSCGPLTLDSVGGLLSYLLGCQCVPGPCEALFHYWLCEESSCPSQSIGLEAALAPVPGAPFVKSLLVRR